MQELLKLIEKDLIEKALAHLTIELQAEVERDISRGLHRESPALLRKSATVTEAAELRVRIHQAQQVWLDDSNVIIV